jgi:transposase
MTSVHKADEMDSKPQSRVPNTGHHDVASDGGAEHWAVIASLIETCKLTKVDPHAYLAETITKIVNRHPNSRLDELLPWAYPAATALKEVA